MKQLYGLLMGLFFIPSTFWGQTAWQSITNLPYLDRNGEYPYGYPYAGGAKLKFIDNHFMLAWADYDYSQSVPTLNYTRLDSEGSDHEQVSLVPNWSPPWNYRIYLDDFVLANDGHVIFSLYDDWDHETAIAHESENDFFMVAYFNQEYPFYSRRAVGPLSLVYGNNIFLAAHSAPSSPYGYPYYYPWYEPLPSAISYSSNGISWTEASLVSGLNVNEVVFDGERFMAAGFYVLQSYRFGPTTSVGIILSSSDGLSWTVSLLPGSTNLAAITRDDETWVAADINGTIFRLQNNIWVRHLPLDDIPGITSMAFGNGHLVVGTSSGRIYSSQDYSTWNLQAIMSGSSVMDVVAGNGYFMSLSPRAVLKSPFSPSGSADIRTHPESFFLIPGDQVNLSVEANGDSPLFYQWYEGEPGNTAQPIPGATGPSFSTPPLYATKHYWVSVSNALGPDASIPAILTMQEQPRITSQPRNIIIEPNQYSSLSVSGAGNNISHQWYFGLSGDTSFPLYSAQSFSHTVHHIQEGVFYYWVRLSNDVGQVDSVTVSVNVVGREPQITEEPRDVTVQQDNSTSLSVSASGYALSYQWYVGESGDTSIPLNETYSSMQPGNKQPGIYSYWVRISNPNGFVDSRTARYTVNPRSSPVITQEPLDLNIYQGGTATVSIAATASSLDYQWFAGASGNLALPLSVTSASFNPPTQVPGIYYYWARAANSSGAVSSRTVTVTVIATGLIGLVKQPQDGWAYHNYSSTLQPMSVSASEAVTSYQWFQGHSGNTSAPISGARSSTFSPSISSTGTFYYWVQVLTESGLLESRTAVLTVLPRLLRLTSEPLDASTFIGRSQYISVSAHGNNLSYQWYAGQSGETNLLVSGATSSTFAPSSTNTGIFSYWVRVSDGNDYVDSRTVTYEVIPQLPSITTQPADLVCQPSQGISLNVSVQYTSGVTYQWYRGVAGDTSNPVSGAKSSWLNHAALPVGTHYFWVKVNNNHGPTESRTAKILVIPANYAQWLAASGLSTNAAGDGAIDMSASGDGHPNLLKYLMGYTPLSFVENSMMTMGVLQFGGQSYGTLTFRLNNYAANAQLIVETSTDFNLWQSNAVLIGPIIEHGDGTSTVTYRQASPLGALPTIFRLRGVQY